MKGLSWGCGQVWGTRRGWPGLGGEGQVRKGAGRRNGGREEPGQALEALSPTWGDQPHRTRVALAPLAHAADLVERREDRQTGPASHSSQGGDSLRRLAAESHYSRRTPGRFAGEGAGLGGDRAHTQGLSWVRSPDCDDGHMPVCVPPT